MRNIPRSSRRTAHASTWSRPSSSVGEVALHDAAQSRQRLGELEHLVELLLVAPRAPVGVVQVLLAPGGVDSRRLQVTARVHADPHVLPRGRDRQLADAGERLLVVDALSVGIEELEPAPAPPARDARLRTIDSSQSAIGRPFGISSTPSRMPRKPCTNQGLPEIARSVGGRSGPCPRPRWGILRRA